MGERRASQRRVRAASASRTARVVDMDAAGDVSVPGSACCVPDPQRGPAGRPASASTAGSTATPRRVIRLGGGAAVAYPEPTSRGVTAVMRGNRKRDTGPELAVRRALYARGRRYVVNRLLRVGDVRVRPDLVFVGPRVAVFIDGCFWHGCPMHGTQPRANPGYWGPKIARNRERDARNTAALESEGWAVVRAWEHENVQEVVRRVEAALASRAASARHARCNANRSARP